jgi:hypothetical protein
MRNSVKLRTNPGVLGVISPRGPGGPTGGGGGPPIPGSGGSNPTGAGSPIQLTGSGSLFSRLGKIGVTINTINAFRGPSAAILTNNIDGQYATADQNLTDLLWTNLTTFQNAAGAFMRPLQQLAQNTVVQMVNNNMPQSDSSIQTALNYLINQMISYGQTVQNCTPSATATYSPLNYGNPNVIYSVSAGDGTLCENIFSEVCTAQCTLDSQTQPLIAMHEPVQLNAQYSISDTFSWKFPVGSGVTVNLTPVSGLDSAAGGMANWLTNSSFESWTVSANNPDSWVVQTGSAGVSVFQSTATFYDGLSSLQILGNGSELTTLIQPVATPVAGFASLPLTVAPEQQFAVNLWLRVSSVPAQGVLQVAFTDSLGNVILDNKGASNQFSVSLTTLSASSWKPFGAPFRLPRVLPSSLQIRLKLTTALSAGINLFVDRLALALMTQMYPGGPSLTVFSGNINMIVGDTFWFNIYNNYSPYHFQNLFDILFNMKSLGFQLPSSAAPSIPDSLIS